MNNMWCFANKWNETMLTIALVQEGTLTNAVWISDIEKRKRWMGFSTR
jgi:hypothetical protein